MPVDERKRTVGSRATRHTAGASMVRLPDGVLRADGRTGRLTDGRGAASRHISRPRGRARAAAPYSETGLRARAGVLHLSSDHEGDNRGGQGRRREYLWIRVAERLVRAGHPEARDGAPGRVSFQVFPD